MTPAASLPPLTALAAAWALCSVNAHAREPERTAARLEWHREADAESCIAAEELTLAVNRRWKHRVFASTGSEDIVVRGTVGRTNASTWSARIELTRADGTSLGSRELVTTAADCSALDDSVALAVGLMLDVSRQRLLEEQQHAAPEASPEGPGGPKATGSTAGPKATGRTAGPEPQSIAIPSQTLAPRQPWRFEAALSPEIGVGMLPGPGLAARGELAVEPPRFWRLSLAFALWESRDAGDAGRGAHFSSWTADLALCPVEVAKSSIVAHLCAVERVGQVTADGFGVAHPATADALFHSAGLRATARWEFAPPFSLVIGADASAPFVRYRFVYRDVTGAPAAVYRMAPVNGDADLGVSVRW